MAEKLTGRTKESHPYLVATSIKIGNTHRGRTKETHTYIAEAAKKNSGRTKENDASVAAGAEKMRERTGAKNHQWRGGLSFEPYTPAFNRALKDSIRQRDGYCCQLCGVPECECTRKLNCHHIDYKKDHTSDNNLVALCKSCNSRVNANRDYWVAYFTKKLRRKKFTIVINWIPKAIKRHQEVAHVVD